jgi:hypothetical protein
VPAVDDVWPRQRPFRVSRQHELVERSVIQTTRLHPSGGSPMARSVPNDTRTQLPSASEPGPPASRARLRPAQHVGGAGFDRCARGVPGAAALRFASSTPSGRRWRRASAEA